MCGKTLDLVVSAYGSAAKFGYPFVLAENSLGLVAGGNGNIEEYALFRCIHAENRHM